MQYHAVGAMLYFHIDKEYKFQIRCNRHKPLYFDNMDVFIKFIGFLIDFGLLIEVKSFHAWALP